VSEAQHTPGPWLVFRDGASQDIAYVRRSAEFCAEEIAVCYSRPNEANASLIAAAPDMLAELEHELEELAGWMHDESISDDTKAAMRIRQGKIQKVIATPVTPKFLTPRSSSAAIAMPECAASA
jgi:hypothetical protein